MRRNLFLGCLIHFAVACAGPGTSSETTSNKSSPSEAEDTDDTDDTDDSDDFSAVSLETAEDPDETSASQDSPNDAESDSEGSQVEESTSDEDSGDEDPSDDEGSSSESGPTNEDSETSSDSSTSGEESSSEESGETEESSGDSSESSSESEESGESEESSDTGDVMFTLTSPAFEEGELIPDAHLHTQVGGENISPELNWVGAPSDAKSFAIFLEDISKPFDHSAIWDIPATTTGLPEDVEHKAMPMNVPGAVQCKQWGKNEYGYGGPGTRKNTYQFTIYAIDVETISEINKDSERRDVHKAFKDHSIGSATLTGKSG